MHLQFWKPGRAFQLVAIVLFAIPVAGSGTTFLPLIGSRAKIPDAVLAAGLEASKVLDDVLLDMTAVDDAE